MRYTSPLSVKVAEAKAELSELEKQLYKEKLELVAELRFKGWTEVYYPETRDQYGVWLIFSPNVSQETIKVAVPDGCRCCLSDLPISDYYNLA